MCSLAHLLFMSELFIILLLFCTFTHVNLCTLSVLIKSNVHYYHHDKILFLNISFVIKLPKGKSMWTTEFLFEIAKNIIKMHYCSVKMPKYVYNSYSCLKSWILFEIEFSKYCVVIVLILLCEIVWHPFVFLC